MSQSLEKTVLVLDDDSAFRQMIAGLFRARGYSIIEASSAQEGTLALANGSLTLAIVDYRLPDIDGMTWIGQMRERGDKTPIVFVTANVCDAHSFNWLRNILKVSLVLQKPILPDLLMQQLEGILPVFKTDDLEDDENTRVLCRHEYDCLLSKYPNAREELDKVFSQGGEALYLIEQFKQLGKRLQLEETFRQAKADYSKQLPKEWEKLSEHIHAFQSDLLNLERKEQGRQIAHKLKGTAGSLGYIEVGKAAGRIDQFLKSFDQSTEETESEIIWAEIFRALAEGETAIYTEALPTEDKLSITQGGQNKILVLSADPFFERKNSKTSIDYVVVDKAINAVQQARSMSFDAAIIDLTLENIGNYFQLAADLRSIQALKGLPLACIDGRQLGNNNDFSFAGFSVQLAKPLNEAEFGLACTKLLTIARINKPRVLVVDDDRVLGNFITTILSSEGMVVQALTEPVQILKVLEDFKPDLVLLDVIMPGLSGYDVCRLLRAHEKWSNLSILFLTSKSSSDGRTAAFNAGADDFLSKPVLTEELMARVKTQLEQSYSRKARLERDELTECLGRKVLMSQLLEFAQGTDPDLAKGCFCLLEIDNFDEISMNHGIFAGEKVLSQLGKVVNTRFKAETKRARWGDKTLAFYFPGETLSNIANVLRLLQQEFDVISFTDDQGHDYKASTSIGIAEFPAEIETLTGVIDLANKRLLAKLRDKTSVLFQVPSL